MPSEGLDNISNNMLGNAGFGSAIGRFWNNISGATNANEFIASENALNREFNSAEAEKAFKRDLQADSTRYQRMVSDLRDAGINPLMAVSGASAGSVSSSPASAGSSGGSGSSGAVIISAILRGISQIVSSAVKGRATTDAAHIRNIK